MKRIITLLPLFSLLAACASDGKRQEVNLFAKKETYDTVFTTLSKAYDAYNNSKVISFESSLKNGLVALNLEAKSLTTKKDAVVETIKLKAALKNVGFEAEGAVTGYTISNTEKTITSNLKAYINAKKISTSVSLNYSLPASFFAKEEKVPDSSTVPATSEVLNAVKENDVTELTEYISPKANFSASISGAKLSAYLENGNAYLDLTDKKIYTFADKFLNSGLISLFPKTKEKYSSYKILEGLFGKYDGMLGISTKGYLPSKFKIEPLDSSTENENWKKLSEEGLYSLDLIGGTVYEYTNSDKYTYGLECNIDKEVLCNIVNEFINDSDEKPEDKLDSAAIFDAIGVELKTIKNTISIKLCKDHSVEFNVKLNNYATVDLNKMVAQKIGCSSLKGDVKLKADFSFKLGLETEFPKLADFSTIPVIALD